MNKNLKLKKGDIVTFKSVIGVEIYTPIIDFNYDGTTIKDFEGERYKVLKVERPIKYKTIYEYKEILDDVEREYLGNFIRPFRNKINYIIKYNSVVDEWLTIVLKDEEAIHLPYFKSNTMYKGMKVNKAYTLEELGL